MLVQAHEGRFVLAALRDDLFTAAFWSRSLLWRYQDDPLGNLGFRSYSLSYLGGNGSGKQEGKDGENS